ncbi:reversion-inducing cysteine-rich protein with Kazal motifs [Orycteropus afer afer]|uniref:Reversion-inducing cysteine-rich protein with Kazal motifs n=1 Tax=Orycteropus afer afer TaxID=1230840 RepID=A0A8B7AB43_ORYAF|nr:reversion-inducing cysteine-rich protein with Kazal motifs [Orycteropus afer afer]
MAPVRASPQGMLLLLLAVTGVAAVAAGLAPGSVGVLCCNHSKDNQMCRDVCEQIFSSKSESRLKHLLQRAPDYCPETMVEIWSCMNSSLTGVFQKSDSWVGLGCCELAVASECRQACKQASSKNDISKVCRKEHENALFSCINRNEMGSVCCSYAGHHTNCREYCQAIFRTDSSPGPSQIKAVENYCASISPQLIHCVNNYTQSYPMKNPTDSLYCCDRAEDHACQSACKRILMSKKTEMEIVDGLIEGCKKQPLPQDPLWLCFLQGSLSRHPGVTAHPPPSTGLDGAKLHCCSKANTSTCRELCTKLYSMSWGNTQSWQEFDRFCEYNPVEVPMLTCLADVREPCQLGCRNLTYCTNFNNRSDCVEILKKCGDRKRFPEDHTAESICELLSPTDDLESCIPLETYLSKNVSLLPLPLLCIPKPQVCLTTYDKFGCSQYECVPRQLTCDQAHDPVCDTDHTDHSNLCTLYQRGKALSYRGLCQPFCRATEPVCGHNGETYSSVCAAYSDRVAVDYHGPCQAVGALSEHGSVTECAAVKCPSLSATGCKPIIPPGACCPLCAGMLRVLFDKEKLDTIAKVTNKKPITILEILEKVRMHVSVPQCDVFGYFSIESEIVILVIPVDQCPKALQIEACNREAEKIESLINSDSPTLASHVPLSALVISRVQVSSSVPAAGTRARAPCRCCLLLFSLGLASPLLWPQN